VASAAAPGYRLRLALVWLAVSAGLPSRWFQAPPPPEAERAAPTGKLHVQIVSHCWRYSHLLAYQLSSLANHPPRDVAVTMTVFYAEEDNDTARLLELFGSMNVPNVSWDWQARDKTRLFRRSIGRNEAALASTADWIWFNDCDVILKDDCLDVLGAELQGRRDTLVYPSHEFVSPVYEPGDPVLEAAREPGVVDIDPASFVRRDYTRAVGAMQITHGDVARAVGYCRNIGVFQQPTDRFAKAREDRAFRWLLGTSGVALEVPGVYRIRHQVKGRYHKQGVSTRLRTQVRKIQLWMREGRADSGSSDS